MKKNLFFVSLLISIGAFAQTAEERAEIKKGINSIEIEKLKLKFAAEYQERQAKIDKYLQANKGAQREFVSGTNAYLLHHIDDQGKPVYINTKDNNQITNSKANSLYQGGSLGVNITGTNMVAGVWDGGVVNANHELLSGKVTMQPNQGFGDKATEAGNDHMQAVSGIMVGKALTESDNEGELGLTAKGIAFDATTKNYDWNDDIAEMTSFAADGYLISNHSYGYSNTTTNNIWNYGAYDSSAKNWDTLLKDTPNYLPFVAAGNEQTINGNTSAKGFDIITGATAAKNVMTVGAIDMNNSMSGYSNWGPTDDGRVKPDIVTLGTAINVPKYTGNTSYTGAVGGSSGTSYSSPAAAAAGLLLQQYYNSIFGKYMTAASLKALMLHTADDAGNPGPDAKFGWGILNVEKAAQTIKQMQNGGSAKLVEFTENPGSDGSAELRVLGLSNGLAARASICWTDDPGVEQTANEGINPTKSRLVYNFDILFRETGSTWVNQYPYKPLSVTDPNATATVGSDWFMNNVDNYKQANITGTTLNNNLTVYVRRSSTSPAEVRNFSVLLTGLKVTEPTLETQQTKASKSIVFYNKEDSKIKLISNGANASFGDYKIYDMSGKLLKSGNEKTNEIFFQNSTKGIYILVYKNKNTAETFRFRL